MTKEFAVIFDMDGVLVDSIIPNRESFKAIFREAGVVISNEEIAQYRGRALKEMLDDWNSKYHTNFEKDNFSKKAFDMQLRLIKEQKRDYSLVSLLDELSKYDVPLGVGTSSSRYRAEELLRV